MIKIPLELGLCKRCGTTIIIKKNSGFYCNKWSCFSMNVKNKSDYNITREIRLVHGIYHKECGDDKK